MGTKEERERGRWFLMLKKSTKWLPKQGDRASNEEAYSTPAARSDAALPHLRGMSGVGGAEGDLSQVNGVGKLLNGEIRCGESCPGHVKDDAHDDMPAVLLSRHVLDHGHVEGHQQAVDRDEHRLVLLVHL